MSIEVLAPVGGEEQLISAIKAGADAVYLGAKSFNARRNAHNFSDLSKTVQFCHENGVKVFVTLNTVIKNREIGSFVKTVKEIADASADGVIVQDLGAVYLIRKICPNLPLHASTQMTVHNISGGKMLESLGFKRAVLARELSAREIKYICDNTDMEIEVFVHGALCVCVSGQCYLSSMLGARSGNRGLCAQPCRLDFKNKERNYAMSLKDMSLFENINELIECGVDSLKIEGRMKRPEYVYKAVKECKNALCGIKPDMDTLKDVFSRSGFTNGYFTGNITPNMFGRRTEDDVASMNKVLGKIESEIDNTSYPKKEPIISQNYQIGEFEALSAAAAADKKKIRVRLENLSQLTDEIIKNADKIILPSREIISNSDKVNKFKYKLIAELPLMFYGSDKELALMLEKLKNLGIYEVVAGNIGTMYEAIKSDFIVHIDYSMNITNKYSVQALKELGVNSCTMSFETNSKDIKGTLPVGIIAYGYLPLMTYRSCPAKTKAGCRNCNKTPTLTDRNGTKFTVICRGAYSQLLNSVPLYLADKMKEVKCDFYTLYFTVENAKKCSEIFNFYANGLKAKGAFTRGLYFKELI